MKKNHTNILLSVLLSSQVHAASFTWDANTNGNDPVNFDGAGTWTAVNYWTGFAGAWNVTNAADTAVFGGIADMHAGIPGAVSLGSGAAQLAGIEFQPYVGNNTKYNITTGTLQFSALNGSLFTNTDVVRPFAAINANIAGTGGITISGAGITEFGTGINTFTGGLTLADQSTLSQDANARLGALTENVTFQGEATLLFRTTTTYPRNFVLNTGAIGQFDVLNTFNATVGGAGVAISGNGSLQKENLGTLTLIGTHTYTGETRMRAGTLALNFNDANSPAADIISPSSSLAFGGGIFSVTGKNAAVTSQTNNGLTLYPGHSTLLLLRNSATSLTQNFGAIARNAGGTMNVSTISAGTAYTTTSSNTNGILGGYATVSNSDWLSINGSSNFTPFTSYQTNVDPASWVVTDNVSLTGNPSPAIATDTTIHSLKLPSASSISLPAGKTLTLSSGGLLSTGASSSSITGGTLKGAASADLVVHQYSTSAFTISSTIADNAGATSLTKVGSGTLTLNGTNSYSGNTYLNAGTLEANSDSALGTGATVTARPTTTLTFSGTAPIISAKNFTFELGAEKQGGTANSANGSSANFKLNITNTAGVTLSGAINIRAGTLTKLGAGALTLTNSGTNTLGCLNGGLGMNISNGSVIFDGGTTSSYNLGQSELSVGDTNANSVLLEIKSGAFNNGSFSSIGRGNGTTGLTATVRISNAASMNTGNFYTGFAAGIAGYKGKQIIEVKDNAQLNASGGIRLSESTGSSTVMSISNDAALRANDLTEIAYGTNQAILNLSGNAQFTTSQITVGRGANTAGAAGQGIINQTGNSSITQTGPYGGDWRVGGANGTNDANVYGAWNLSDTATVSDGNRNFQIGAFGKGIMQINGGTVNTGGWFVIGRFPGSFGVVNLDGGVLNHTNAGTRIIVGEESVGNLNVRGGTLNAGGGLTLGHNNGVAGEGVVNLITGGTINASFIADQNANSADGFSYFNFNGGTLKPQASHTAFMEGLTATTIFQNHAVIDTDGKDITIAQLLAPPTESGVSEIIVASSGSGYKSAPVVQITGGGGTGATAVAVMNATGDAVQRIQITNPGTGYTSTPTVTISGGVFTNATDPSPGTAATLGAVSISPNITSGGLIKQGEGVLTLTNTNTYTGNTTVSAGTLSLADDYLADTASVSVATGATINLTHSDIDVVASLTLGGVSVSGVWGALDSDAPNKSELITGTGKLQAGTAANPYGTWAAAAGLTSLNNALLDDPDHDCMANLLEYFLNGNPLAFTAAPALSVSGGASTINFKRRDDAEGDVSTQQIEISTDLTAWTSVTIPATSGTVSGVTFTITENGSGADDINATISHGADNKKFLRVKITD